MLAFGAARSIISGRLWPGGIHRSGASSDTTCGFSSMSDHGLEPERWTTPSPLRSTGRQLHGEFCGGLDDLGLMRLEVLTSEAGEDGIEWILDAGAVPRESLED
jgi:hypothetical protein